MTEQALVEKVAEAMAGPLGARVPFDMLPADASQPRLADGSRLTQEVLLDAARAALSVIREALSEPSLQAEVDRLRVALARIEHECIIRQPATALQTVKDVRAIAREAIALKSCVSSPIGEK
jgi:hypothetical protein